MVSRYTAMCDFRKQASIAVAPGYVLEGAGLQMLPDGNGVGRPDLLWAHKAEVIMRSAKNNLREAEDTVLALSANTEVHRWPPLAVLAVPYFTAIARLFGARALLEPPGGPAGWRGVVFMPEAGVLVYWQPKR
jgi:hypothetical protein